MLCTVPKCALFLEAPQPVSKESKNKSNVVCSNLPLPSGKMYLKIVVSCFQMWSTEIWILWPNGMWLCSVVGKYWYYRGMYYGIPEFFDATKVLHERCYSKSKVLYVCKISPYSLLAVTEPLILHIDQWRVPKVQTSCYPSFTFLRSVKTHLVATEFICHHIW